MRLKLNLSAGSASTLPINFQYPMSAAIYKILGKADGEFAELLHSKGYGKGFKLFTFSQIDVPFKVIGDRMKLLQNEANILISFHLPQAMEHFIAGLFQSERIEIGDNKSKMNFYIKSLELQKDPLAAFKGNEIIKTRLVLKSPIVAGVPNEKGNYVFLSPDNDDFVDCLKYNWNSKILTCFKDEGITNPLLFMKVLPSNRPFKPRLVIIKANTPQETKIKGWLNFELEVQAEKRFIELLLNAGCGIYNSLGMGCVEVRNSI